MDGGGLDACLQLERAPLIPLFAYCGVPNTLKNMMTTDTAANLIRLDLQ